MICLDSTTIIDFLKNKKEAVAVIRDYREQDSLITTEISAFEIFAGIYLKDNINNEELNRVIEFFKSIDVLPFDELCGQEAAQIYATLSKSGKMIEEADIFISAIMKKNGCLNIITRNKEHFLRINGIKVIGY